MYLERLTIEIGDDSSGILKMCSWKSFILLILVSLSIPFFLRLSIIISSGRIPLNSFSKNLISLTNEDFLGISSIKFPEISILFIPTILTHKHIMEIIKTGILWFFTVLLRNPTNTFNQLLLKWFKCFFSGSGRKL